MKECWKKVAIFAGALAILMPGLYWTLSLQFVLRAEASAAHQSIRQESQQRQDLDKLGWLWQKIMETKLLIAKQPNNRELRGYLATFERQKADLEREMKKR